MTELKIALCQMKILYEEKKVNLMAAEEWVARAAMSGAALVLFPEMSFTGFSMNTHITGEWENNSETVEQMRIQACRYKIGIGFGWTGTDSEMPKRPARNHYTVVDEEGRIIADYIKIHPFSYGGESRVFEGGMEPVTFNFHGHVFGLSICYDLRFPELYQCLSREADVLIAAANWPAKRQSHWNVLLQARAVENQSYMLGINCTGEQENISYTGGTVAFAPEGERLPEEVLSRIPDGTGLDGHGHMGTETEEKLVCISIKDMAWRYRKEFPLKQDRNEKLYKTWYDKQ